MVKTCSSVSISKEDILEKIQEIEKRLEFAEKTDAKQTKQLLLKELELLKLAQKGMLFQ